MSDAVAGQGLGRSKPRIPLLPLALGLGGLVPFWGLALSRVTGLTFGLPAAFVSVALASYAATILAFLGGIRWGAAMRPREATPAAAEIAVSIVPQLAGWMALALPDPWRFFVLGILLLGLGPLDRGLVSRGLAPPWFGRLRVILSLGAGAALFLAGLA